MIKIQKNDKVITLSEQQFQDIRELIDMGLEAKIQECNLINTKLEQMLKQNQVTERTDILSQILNDMDHEISLNKSILKLLNQIK